MSIGRGLEPELAMGPVAYFTDLFASLFEGHAWSSP